MPSLRAEAKLYWEKGFRVIPFRYGTDSKGERTKKPDVESWKEWQERPQTVEDFDGLRLETADGFGLLCGVANHRQLYLAALDFDVKGTPSEASLELGKKILREMPVTRTERTQSGGAHLYYLSYTPVTTDKSFKSHSCIEFLGFGGLVYIAPSLGYTRINDNGFTEALDIQKKFYEVLAQNGLEREIEETEEPEQAENEQPEPDLNAVFSNEPVVKDLYNGNWQRYSFQSRSEAEMSVVTALVRNGFKPNSIRKAMKDCKIGKWQEAGSAYQKMTLKKAGAFVKQKGLGKKKADDEAEEEQIVCINKPTVLTPSFLAEMVWDRKNLPEYVVYDFKTESFSRTDKLDLGERDAKGRQIIYVPPYNDSLKKGLVIVPMGYDQTTFTDLFSEIDQFATSAYDPCGQDALVKLLARVAVGSWFIDRFVDDPVFDIAGSGKFAPLLPIRGPSQSGKNRLAFVLRLISYRPYFEMSTYRIPSLYRPLDLWQGTLVLDEADFAKTNEKSELVHFLNCRATGTPLSRQNPKNPMVTNTFSNFGLTILTQRRQFDDNATESRSIPFYSETTDKRLAVVETDEMLKKGLELQSKLLFLRMKYFRKVSIDKTAWLNDLSDHRLVASLLPLLALSKHEPSLRETITQTAKEVERAKIEEKANSMDGLLVNALWEKISERLFDPWRPNIFYVLESRNIREEEGIEIEEKVALTTKNLADNFKWSPQSIRKALNSLNLAEKGLPNSIKVGGKSQRVIFFDPRRLEKRLREFVVNYEPNSVTQVTQVTDFLCGGEQKIEDFFEDAPHIKSVTPVTPVSEHDSGGDRL